MGDQRYFFEKIEGDKMLKMSCGEIIQMSSPAEYGVARYEMIRVLGGWVFNTSEWAGNCDGETGTISIASVFIPINNG